MGGPQQHASRTQGEQRRRGDGGRHAEGPPHPRDPARSTESVSDEDPETGGRTKFRTPARTTISFAVRRRGRSVPLRRTLRRRGRSVHHRRRRGRTLRRRGRIPRVRRHLPGGGAAAYGSSNPVSVEGSGGRVWPRVRLLADRHDVMESIRVLTPERVGVHDLPLPARPHSARHAARPQLLGPSGGPILRPPACVRLPRCSARAELLRPCTRPILRPPARVRLLLCSARAQLLRPCTRRMLRPSARPTPQTIRVSIPGPPVAAGVTGAPGTQRNELLGRPEPVARDPDHLPRLIARDPVEDLRPSASLTPPSAG